jgi:hypothetical protein
MLPQVQERVKAGCDSKFAIDSSSQRCNALLWRGESDLGASLQNSDADLFGFISGNGKASFRAWSFHWEQLTAPRKGVIAIISWGQWHTENTSFVRDSKTFHFICFVGNAHHYVGQMPSSGVCYLQTLELGEAQINVRRCAGEQEAATEERYKY